MSVLLSKKFVSVLIFLIRLLLGKICIKELFCLLLFVLFRAHIKYNPNRNDQTHFISHIKKLTQSIKRIFKYKNRKKKKTNQV